MTVRCLVEPHLFMGMIMNIAEFMVIAVNWLRKLHNNLSAISGMLSCISSNWVPLVHTLSKAIFVSLCIFGQFFPGLWWVIAVFFLCAAIVTASVVLLI